jgi:hypothetical protein
VRSTCVARWNDSSTAKLERGGIKGLYICGSSVGRVSECCTSYLIHRTLFVVGIQARVKNSACLANDPKDHHHATTTVVARVVLVSSSLSSPMCVCVQYVRTGMRFAPRRSGSATFSQTHRENEQCGNADYPHHHQQVQEGSSVWPLACFLCYCE